MAVLNLGDKTGTFYNIGSASTDASHSVTGAVAGGNATIEVNRTGEPTVSISGGVATKIAGVNWENATKKYLNVFSYDGVNVLYFFTDEVSGFDRNDRLEENATVIGAKNIDWNLFEIFKYTLTGNVTLSDINLPNVGGKTITLMVTGDFAITYPTGWNTTFVNGVYDGTVLNQIVVQYVKSATPYYVLQISQPV